MFLSPFGFSSDPKQRKLIRQCCISLLCSWYVLVLAWPQQWPQPAFPVSAPYLSAHSLDLSGEPKQCELIRQTCIFRKLAVNPKQRKRIRQVRIPRYNRCFLIFPRNRRLWLIKGLWIIKMAGGHENLVLLTRVAICSVRLLFLKICDHQLSNVSHSRVQSNGQAGLGFINKTQYQHGQILPNSHSRVQNNGQAQSIPNTLNSSSANNICS